MGWFSGTFRIWSSHWLNQRDWISSHKAHSSPLLPPKASGTGTQWILNHSTILYFPIDTKPVCGCFTASGRWKRIAFSLETPEAFAGQLTHCTYFPICSVKPLLWEGKMIQWSNQVSSGHAAKESEKGEDGEHLVAADAQSHRGLEQVAIYTALKP